MREVIIALMGIIANQCIDFCLFMFNYHLHNHSLSTKFEFMCLFCVQNVPDTQIQHNGCHLLESLNETKSVYPI